MIWDTTRDITLEVAGATLNGRCFGPSPDEAPSIVLLHEGLGSVALWRDFPERLVAATGFGVFAYDRRGYGRSSKPANTADNLPYSKRAMANDLVAVMANLRHGRFAVAGHDRGDCCCCSVGTPPPSATDHNQGMRRI